LAYHTAKFGDTSTWTVPAFEKSANGADTVGNSGNVHFFFSVHDPTTDTHRLLTPTDNNVSPVSMSKKQRARAAKAAKALQAPVAAPPPPHKTLRQQARAAERSMRRAPGNTPAFIYGDNVVPRALGVKPPPPQLMNACPTWNGHYSLTNPTHTKLRMSDTRAPDEAAYSASVMKQVAQKSSAFDVSVAQSTRACTREEMTEQS